MRRLTGLVLMASVLRFTAVDLRAECERHAERAVSAAAAATGAGEQAPGHDHHGPGHAASAADAGSQPPTDESAGSLPTCCVVSGTCGSSTLADIGVTRASPGDFRRATWSPAPRVPLANIQAPEPPPPKA